MQSTYCSQLHTHCASIGRVVHVVNLDPAAERFSYPVAADVRDLISLDVRLCRCRLAVAAASLPSLTRFARRT